MMVFNGSSGLAAVTLAFVGVVFVRDIYKIWKKKPTKFIDYTLFEAPSKIVAGAVFPPLVTLRCYFDGDHHTSDVGFIVYSDYENTFIWGHAKFLYSSKEKELRKGRVEVTIRGHCDYLADRFQGCVLYVDYPLDLVIIRVKHQQSKMPSDATLAGVFPMSARNDQQSKKLPVATLACVSPLSSKNDCIDFISSFNDFEVTSYTFQPSSECQQYFHVFDIGTSPGVMLNAQGEVVGIKTSKCLGTQYISHVIPIALVVDRLEARTLRSKMCDQDDIRFRQTSQEVDDQVGG